MLKIYLKIIFDVNLHFARFFLEPFQLCHLQATTCFVVSSSNALQFLNQVVYPESDLDLYVNFQNALDICKFIQNNMGWAYTFLAYGKENQVFMPVRQDFVAHVI